MDIIEKLFEFKTTHPGHYWMRLILFWAIVFFAFTYVQVEDAEGAVVESEYNESNIYWNDFSGNQKFTHTKDDYIVTAYCDDDGDIMVAYRKPNGSWNHSEVSPVDFDGATQWKLGAIINTDNNSLVLMAGGQVGSYYRVYYFTKFAGDDWDEWDSLLFLYQASVSFYMGDHAINDTGIILGMCRKSSGNVWTYRIFDFEAYTLGGGDAGTAWETGAASATGFCIEANQTGKFWISWKDTDNVYYVMDFEKDLSQVAFQVSTYYIVQAFAFLDNGVCVAVGGYAYGVSTWPEYYHQEVPGDPFLDHRLDSVNSRLWNNNYQIVVRSGSTVPVIVAYNEDDEALYTYGAEWDASEEVWQNSISDTGLSSDDEYFPEGASNSLWPSHVSTGINWTRLTSGWAITAEDDDPDPDSFVLISDGMNWTVDLTTDDPEITTIELPNAEYGVYYSYTLEKDGGTIPHSWSLLIGPEWMSIGPVNGTIYGTPDGTGTEQVRAELADGVPRYDEVQWTLTIGAASEGGDSEFDPSVAWALWWGDVSCISAFMVVAVIVLIGFLIIRSRI